jgi:hypothetical protein
MALGYVTRGAMGSKPVKDEEISCTQGKTSDATVALIGITLIYSLNSQVKPVIIHTLTVSYFTENK